MIRISKILICFLLGFNLAVYPFEPSSSVAPQRPVSPKSAFVARVIAEKTAEGWKNVSRMDFTQPEGSRLMFEKGAETLMYIISRNAETGDFKTTVFVLH